MKNELPNTNTNIHDWKQPEEKSIDAEMQSSHLMKLFGDGLKYINRAEKAFTKTIPKMLQNAISEDWIESLTKHLAETENQISGLVQTLTSLDKKSTAQKGDTTEGMIKEASERMELRKADATSKTGIISAELAIIASPVVGDSEKYPHNQNVDKPALVTVHPEFFITNMSGGQTNGMKENAKQNTMSR